MIWGGKTNLYILTSRAGYWHYAYGLADALFHMKHGWKLVG